MKKVRTTMELNENIVTLMHEWIMLFQSLELVCFILLKKCHWQIILNQQSYISEADSDCLN